jgi:hypothetical protein
MRVREQDLIVVLEVHELADLYLVGKFAEPECASFGPR